MARPRSALNRALSAAALLAAGAAASRSATTLSLSSGDGGGVTWMVNETLPDGVAPPL